MSEGDWLADRFEEHRGRLRAIALRNAGEGWAVGDAGLALHTTDGGATWMRVDLGTAQTLRGVSLPTGRTGPPYVGRRIGLRPNEVKDDPARSRAP